MVRRDNRQPPHEPNRERDLREKDRKREEQQKPVRKEEDKKKQRDALEEALVAAYAAGVAVLRNKAALADMTAEERDFINEMHRMCVKLLGPSQRVTYGVAPTVDQRYTGLGEEFG